MYTWCIGMTQSLIFSCTRMMITMEPFLFNGHTFQFGKLHQRPKKTFNDGFWQTDSQSECLRQCAKLQQITKAAAAGLRSVLVLLLLCTFVLHILCRRHKQELLSFFTNYTWLQEHNVHMRCQRQTLCLSGINILAPAWPPKSLSKTRSQMSQGTIILMKLWATLQCFVLSSRKLLVLNSSIRNKLKYKKIGPATF